MNMADPKNWFNRIESDIGDLLSRNFAQEAPAFLASAAISLKRIADVMEVKPIEELTVYINGEPTILYRETRSHSRNVFNSAGGELQVVLSAP